MDALDFCFRYSRNILALNKKETQRNKYCHSRLLHAARLVCHRRVHISTNFVQPDADSLSGVAHGIRHMGALAITYIDIRLLLRLVEKVARARSAIDLLRIGQLVLSGNQRAHIDK